jgi:3-oxoacyl-[acyl-carrier protein] reductase
MSEQQGELAGQTAVVTGGSRGIGRAIALQLARQGARVVVNYRTRADEAAAVCREIEALGAQAQAVVADVSQSAEVERLFAAAAEVYGSVDVLVNNAGIARDNLLLRLSEADWDAVLDTNLKAAYLCSRAALRGMVRAHRGRIVNVASVIALGANPGQANYAAAKAGLIALTRTVAREVGSRGITVNAVAPGFVESDMTRAMSDQARRTLTERIALDRLGSAEDVAAAVGYLCSPSASYITGHVLVVDGGLSL